MIVTRYGPYPIPTELRTQKDETTLVIERYALRSAPDDKVVEFRRVFEKTQTGKTTQI